MVNMGTSQVLHAFSCHRLGGHALCLPMIGAACPTSLAFREHTQLQPTVATGRAGHAALQCAVPCDGAHGLASKLPFMSSSHGAGG